MNRALNYYLKGLPIGFRQELFDFLKQEISSTTMKYFLEKPDGYPSYRSCGFTDEQIQMICDSYIEKFEHVNLMMAEVGRPPLFADPHDSYRCAQEHTMLMEMRADEDLHALFGCTYADYIPPTL